MTESKRDRPARFISDEPTVELIARAREGDRAAVEALLQRCLPDLNRWAHGKLPQFARGGIDTSDLVQEAALRAIQQLDVFEPRHVGAMQAYLRRSVINRIIDQVRRVTRHPAPIPLDEEQAATDASPLEVAIGSETYDRYRVALKRLKPRQRQIVVARVEMQWTLAQITKEFGFPTVGAATVAVGRALQILKRYMHESREAT